MKKKSKTFTPRAKILCEQFEKLDHLWRYWDQQFFKIYEFDTEKAGAIIWTKKFLLDQMRVLGHQIWCYYLVMPAKYRKMYDNHFGVNFHLEDTDKSSEYPIRPPLFK